MGSVWLDGRTYGYANVVDVLRRAGVNVAEYAGWPNRSRSSGGFEGAVYGIVVHHTASNTTPANDLHYMVNGSPDAPVSNGLLDRDGTFTIIAGGASNHAGKGGGSSDGGGETWLTSRGAVPANSANSRCFGIEAANAGTGQAWTQPQQDAYVLMCRALCDAYGMVPSMDIRAHQEWSPPRKCDPTGPSRFAPVGNGRGCNGADLWDMSIFRNEVASGATPPPIPEDDEMPRLSNPLLQGTGKDGSMPGAVYMTDGLLCSYWWIPNEGTLKDVQYALRVNGLPDSIQTVDNLAAFGVLSGPRPGS